MTLYTIMIMYWRDRDKYVICEICQWYKLINQQFEKQISDIFPIENNSN